MSEVIKVPDIGDFADVPIVDILVKPGDRVSAEDPLLTLESEKATLDIPSPGAGVVKQILVAVGDNVSEGTAIVELDDEQPAAADPGETAASSSSPQGPGSDKERAPAPAEGPADDASKGSAEGPAEGASESRAQPAPDSAPESAPAREQAAGKPRQFDIPDIGDFTDVPVVDVHVAPGDRVEAEQPLLTLESDKASMEIPAPVAGTIEQMLVDVGATVSAGTPMARIAPAAVEDDEQRAARDQAPEPTAPEQRAADTAAPPQAPGPAREVSPPKGPDGAETVGSSASAKALASPAVRKLARELGVDLGLVKGSGRKGRVLKSDVKAFIKSTLRGTSAAPPGAGGLALPQVPPVDFSKFGEVETVELSRVRQFAGQNLHRSWISVPHVTQFDRADITDVEAFRKDKAEEVAKDGVKLTLVSFLLKASVAALKRFPEFNSSLGSDGKSLVMKKYFHIGVAVNTDHGLVVPVLRDVDKKGLVALAGELMEVSERARNKQIKPDEMQGGCFTISSLGGVGGTGFTPIINAPEVAILGVSRAAMQPVYRDGTFVPRLLLPFALSYDHRVIDGVAAARFTQYLSTVLSDIRHILL